MPANCRELCDVLWAASAQPVAPSVLVLARAFYRTRDALGEEGGTSRRAVRPDMPIDELPPVDGARQGAWRRVSARLGSAHLASLDRPSLMEWTIAVATVTLVFLATAIIVRLARPDLAWLVAILITALPCRLQGLLAATRPWAVHFRHGPSTVGDLARTCVQVDAVALALPHDRLTRAQIEEVVREIMRPRDVRHARA